jgi:hypothetical protein
VAEKVMTRFRGIVSGMKQEPNWKERIPIIGEQFFAERMRRQQKQQLQFKDFMNYEYPLLNKKEQMGIRSYIRKELGK